MKKGFLLLICFGCVVAIFLLVPLSNAVYKRLATSAKSVSASEWSVTLTQMSANNNVTLVSGSGTQTYSLKVRSESEVNVIYDIEIGNIPAGVKIKLDQNQNYETPDQNNKIIFTDAGSIAYSSQGGEQTHVLTFTTAPGTQLVYNRQLTVKVIAQQEL